MADGSVRPDSVPFPKKLVLHPPPLGAQAVFASFLMMILPMTLWFGQIVRTITISEWRHFGVVEAFPTSINASLLISEWNVG